MRRNVSVAMPPASTGREPSRSGPEQGRSPGHESQDHGAPPRTVDILFCARDRIVDPPFSFGGREPRARSH